MLICDICEKEFTRNMLFYVACQRVSLDLCNKRSILFKKKMGKGLSYSSMSPCEHELRYL